MLLLEGQRKAIDDGTQDLQQLGYPVMSLRLVHEPVEHMVDGPPDVRPTPLATATYQSPPHRPTLHKPSLPCLPALYEPGVLPSIVAAPHPDLPVWYMAIPHW